MKHRAILLMVLILAMTSCGSEVAEESKKIAFLKAIVMQLALESPDDGFFPDDIKGVIGKMKDSKFKKTKSEFLSDLKKGDVTYRIPKKKLDDFSSGDELVIEWNKKTYKLQAFKSGIVKRTRNNQP